MPSHLKRVATLPGEVFVLKKNRNDPKLSEARLCHSKHLLKIFTQWC